MNRARIFVVRTLRDADLLRATLVKADRQAELLDQALLLDESGKALFPGHAAAVICLIASEAEAREVDSVYETSHVEAIVLDRELSDQEDSSRDRLTSVFYATNSLEANLLKNLLTERGIEAVVASDSIQSGISRMLGPAITAVVLVAQRHVSLAKELIEQVTAGQSSLEGNSMSEDEQEDLPEVITAWPMCPDCRRPRTTVCPICETSGTEFPRADENFFAGQTNQALDPSRLPVICTTCDEPWLAEFLRCCEWCNHDFGQGLELELAGPMNLDDRELNSRAGLVTLALGAIVLGLLLYFTLVIDAR
jgi:hypothetical protein